MKGSRPLTPGYGKPLYLPATVGIALAWSSKVIGAMRDAGVEPHIWKIEGLDSADAVGRTLWEAPLRDLIAGTIGRGAAVLRIAARYLETVNGFVA